MDDIDRFAEVLKIARQFGAETLADAIETLCEAQHTYQFSDSYAVLTKIMLSKLREDARISLNEVDTQAEKLNAAINRLSEMEAQW